MSVVICAYTLERWDALTAAVSSVQQQSLRVHEVIVVIDHNEVLFERAQRSLVGAMVLPNAGPAGLSAGRNTGVAACTGDVVAFLDDDAAAHPTWAEHLLAPYADGSVVGVGGLVLPDWRAPRPDWFPEEFLWVVGCSYRGLPSQRARVRNSIGANMSFRRSVFERAGGFDLTIGRIGKDAAGCEETEFSLRAAHASPGGHITFEPSAVVRHVVTEERTTRAYFRRRCRAEGRSKALVSALAGPGKALSSERTYTTKTLPSGIVRGLRQSVNGEWAGARRAWAIAEGFSLTAMAYASERARHRSRLRLNG